MTLNSEAYIAESAACDSLFDAQKQALLGRVAQPLRLGAYCSCSESSSIVAVEALEDGTEINTHYIALLDYALLAGYSMNNLIVYGNACGGRIAVVIKEVRLCAALNNVVIGNLVYLSRGNTRLNCLSCQL